MKKTNLTILALLVLMTMTVAANGVKENPSTDTWAPGQGYRMTQNGTQSVTPPYETGDELTLTGTLKISENNEIELVTKEGTFDLMYPRYNTPDVDVKEGQEVTVKGYEVPAYRWNSEEDTKHLHVVEATVDGKTYTFENSYQMGPGSRTAGRMGGRMDGQRGGRTGDWHNNTMPRGGARW